MNKINPVRSSHGVLNPASAKKPELHSSPRQAAEHSASNGINRPYSMQKGNATDSSKEPHPKGVVTGAAGKIPALRIVRNAYKAAKALKADEESKISDGTAFLMVSLALFFDSGQGIANIIGLIPIVGNIFGSMLAFIIGFFAWLSFYTWFKIHGVNFMSPKRLIAFLGAGITELIPYINILPAWTFAVLFIIATTRIEEKTGINITKVAGAGNITHSKAT